MNPLGGANTHLVSPSELKEPMNSYNNQHLEYVISAAYGTSFCYNAMGDESLHTCCNIHSSRSVTSVHVYLPCLLLVSTQTF